MPNINSLVLQFYGYSVPQISFKLGDSFGGEKVQMDIKMNRTIESLPKTDESQDAHYNVTIYLTIGTEEDENGFFADLAIKGHFSTNGDCLPVDNATDIQFPYVRSTVSSLCMVANIPPLVLPTINIIDAFKQPSIEKS